MTPWFLLMMSMCLNFDMRKIKNPTEAWSQPFSLRCQPRIFPRNLFLSQLMPFFRYQNRHDLEEGIRLPKYSKVVPLRFSVDRAEGFVKSIRKIFKGTRMITMHNVRRSTKSYLSLYLKFGIRSTSFKSPGIRIFPERLSRWCRVSQLTSKLLAKYLLDAVHLPQEIFRYRAMRYNLTSSNSRHLHIQCLNHFCSILSSECCSTVGSLSSVAKWSFPVEETRSSQWLLFCCRELTVLLCGS